MSNFFKATLIRTIRTMAQTAIASIGTSAVLSEIDWKIILSTCAVAGLLCVLNAIATGLPEVEN